MFKKLFLLFILFLLGGCSFDKGNTTDNDNVIDTQEDVVVEEDKYIDDNPIKLGIFLMDYNYRNKSVITDVYYADLVSGKDIASFEVFYTSDEVIDGNNFKDTWNTYYNKYSDIGNYKIGYNIKFILSDGTNFNHTFLEPDIFYFADYFYVYFYDDVHQDDGAFYSHLEEVNGDTLMTSVKLYAVSGIDNVENIVLSAFTYDSLDDFDDEGNYRGESRYTIRIKRKWFGHFLYLVLVLVISISVTISFILPSS